MEDICKKRLKQVKALQKIIQPKQRSKEWFDIRSRMVTASAVADAIGDSKYKSPLEFVVEKCGFPSYQDSDATHHGVKYENIATLIYSERNNVKVLEFGLLPHPKHDFLGASPDGICSNKTLNSKESQLVGRMLEIKCPLSREIKVEGEIDGDICPHYYYVQVQIQLDVCDLDECDFLQCKITEYNTRDDYINDDNSDNDGTSLFTGLEHGCVLRFLPKNKVICKCCENSDIIGCAKTKYLAKYIYPPSSRMCLDEVNEFISDSLEHFPTSNVRFEIVNGSGSQKKNKLTSLEPIFTDKMVGGSVIYYSGEEVYITAFISSTSVTVSKQLNITEETFTIKFNEYVFDKVLYWRVELLTITLIKRDTEWIKKVIPLIRNTWNFVLYYRDAKNKEKLMCLKRVYDRYQAKFADKKDLVKFSCKILEEYMKNDDIDSLDAIILKYLAGKPEKIKKKVPQYNEALFLDSE